MFGLMECDGVTFRKVVIVTLLGIKDFLCVLKSVIFS